MKTITVLEFRKNAQQIISWAQQGQRMIMTYRGKPVCRLEPILSNRNFKEDQFYHLSDLAVEGQLSLENDEMDRILYET